MSALLISVVSSSPEKVEESFVDNVTKLCHWIINNQTCPDPEIRFYLYTSANNGEQLIHIDDTSDGSNLSSSSFDPQRPSKIIIHGFRSSMFLTPLFQMKTGEFRHETGISAMNWFAWR